MQPASNGYSAYSRDRDRDGYGGGGGSSSYGASAGGYASQPAPRAAGHASFNSGGPASDMGDPYRREKGILVSGRDVPPPMTSFERAGFTREILSEVRMLP